MKNIKIVLLAGMALSILIACTSNDNINNMPSNAVSDNSSDISEDIINLDNSPEYTASIGTEEILGREYEIYDLIPEEESNDSRFEVAISQDAIGTLPVLYITTNSGQDITDRYEYVDGGLVIDNRIGMHVTNGSNHVEPLDSNVNAGQYADPYDEDYAFTASYDINVRGRGNASWYMFEQKSYMIKFNDLTSIFGMTPSEKYVLISNGADYTLMHNVVAMDIASGLDGLEYTAGQMPVDVYINDEYQGIYILSEKLEIAEDKINLFSEGDYETVTASDNSVPAFLLETGNYIYDDAVYNQDYLFSGHSAQLFIKYPEINEPGTPVYNEILAYMRSMDQSLVSYYSTNFENYIDMDSWVDWFIVMELTCNTDSSLLRSTYLYRRPDGKLHIGPVWDFDMAFGNYGYDNKTYEYWATAEPIYQPNQEKYYWYLYRSDVFMHAVCLRWDEIKDELLDRAYTAIDKYDMAIDASRPAHNERWHAYASTYGANSMKSFIQHRYNWINMSLHTYYYNRHEPTECIPPEGFPTISENAAENENNNENH